MLCQCCVRFGAVILAVLLSAVYVELLLRSDLRHAQTFSSGVKDFVDLSKYDLFSTSYTDKRVKPFHSGIEAIPVPVVHFQSEDTVRNAVEHREPAVIVNSSANHWGALEWDIWELAKKFPLLLGTAVSKDPESSTILLENDREPGGMITEASGMLQPAVVVQDMLFVSFLNTFKDKAVRMFYSSDFRIVQRMIDVSS